MGTKPSSRSEDYKERQRVSWRKWYHSLSSEERAARYAKKLHREASNPRYAEVRRAYLNKNRIMLRAKNHTARCIKQYPLSITAQSPTVQELADFLLSSEGKLCKYCGDIADSIDHLTPLVQGGKHEWSNIDMICLQCNVSKMKRTHEEFVNWIKKLNSYITEGELNERN